MCGEERASFSLSAFLLFVLLSLKAIAQWDPDFKVAAFLDVQKLGNQLRVSAVALISHLPSTLSDFSPECP